MSPIQRRQFLLAAGALLAAPRIGRARGKLPVLGVLKLNPTVRDSPLYIAFHGHMRKLGWVEGENLLVERAEAGNRLERLPELAAGLVAKNVDVIWTNSPESAVAAARATKTIPIVFWQVGFPVELGLVDSLARPGRNVTGLAFEADESIYVKHYQLLKELAPNATRVGTITDPSNLSDVNGNPLDLSWLRDKIRAATNRLGMQRRSFPVHSLADFDAAFAAIEKWGADSLSVDHTPLTWQARKRIIDFARRLRLVDVYHYRGWVEAGGLMSYGIVYLPTLLRGADMLDQILRGAKPADMPVELPSEHELAVNLATAKKQGFEVPQSILLRADRIIE